MNAYSRTLPGELAVNETCAGKGAGMAADAAFNVWSAEFFHGLFFLK